MNQLSERRFSFTLRCSSRFPIGFLVSSVRVGSSLLHPRTLCMHCTAVRNMQLVASAVAATCARARKHSSFILSPFAEGYWVNTERSGESREGGGAAASEE